MPKVSVIIPVYNEEKYIKKCLSSLKNQNFKDTEIIVVDDGSTDETVKIVKSFKSIKLISGEHKGPGFSRNLGAKAAKGEILVFVDADMEFEKNYLKNLIAPIIENLSIIGTTHNYEIATNLENFYSRLWGKIRVSREKAHEVKIFRAIRKNKFIELGGFDSKYGYADDQTFYYKYGITPVVALKTTCYHRNPETLNETYKQAKWIGKSWKMRFKIFNTPIINIFALGGITLFLPLKALLNSINVVRSEPGISFITALKFYSTKFFGYLTGIFSSVFFNKVEK